MIWDLEGSIACVGRIVPRTVLLMVCEPVSRKEVAGNEHSNRQVQRDIPEDEDSSPSRSVSSYRLLNDFTQHCTAL
jgi:hypothetical protein